MASGPRKRKESSALERVQEGAEKLERTAQWIAIRGGAVGLVGLVVCGGLALLPPEQWPEWLDRSKLAHHAVLCLALGSLVGWGIVQQGTIRLRKACGPVPGGLIFALLPLVTGTIEFLRGRDLVDPASWEHGEVVAPLIRWYAPVLVAVTLVAYVTWQARPREAGRFGRGLGLSLVVAPYALLMASLTFGVSAPWLQGPLGEAFADLGGGALAAQLVLAFLLSA